jgi:hypothetical protein
MENDEIIGAQQWPSGCLGKDRGLGSGLSAKFGSRGKMALRYFKRPTASWLSQHPKVALRISAARP